MSNNVNTPRQGQGGEGEGEVEGEDEGEGVVEGVGEEVEKGGEVRVA